jgi:hypothetical protein
MAFRFLRGFTPLIHNNIRMIHTSDWKNGFCKCVLAGGLFLMPHTVFAQSEPEASARAYAEIAETVTTVGKYRWTLLSTAQAAASVAGSSKISAPRKIDVASIAELTNALAARNWNLRIDISPRPNPGGVAPIPTTTEVIAENGISPKNGNPIAAGISTSTSLNATVAMVGGRLVLQLKNTDRVRPFSGIASVTVSDGKNEDGLPPLRIELAPDEERRVLLEGPNLKYGDSVLLVYDDQRILRLIRSNPFGERPAATQKAPEPVLLGGAPQNIPGFEITTDIEARANALGEDDPGVANPQAPAPPKKDAASLNITGVYDLEIEGGPGPGATPPPSPTPAKKPTP